MIIPAPLDYLCAGKVNRRRQRLCTGCYGNLLCFSSAFHLFTGALKQSGFPHILVSGPSLMKALIYPRHWVGSRENVAAETEVKPHAFGPP